MRRQTEREDESYFDYACSDYLPHFVYLIEHELGNVEYYCVKE